MDSATEKFQRGLQRLAEAGDNRDDLGQALLSLHGALEDYCREWLAGNPQVSPEERAAVLDRQQVQWKSLLDLMRTHASLSEQDRRTVLAMNSLRQRVAHGDSFNGTRQELESYAAFIQRLIGHNPRQVPTPTPQTVTPAPFVHSTVAPAQVERVMLPDSSTRPVTSSKPAASDGLKRIWIGGGRPAVRWRSLFGALLAFFIAGVVFSLALSSLRWQSPLTIIGWFCLALTIALLFLGIRALLKVFLQLGIKRLLMRAAIVYIVAVIIIGLLVPSGQQGISHWIASAWSVVGFTGTSIGGLFQGLLNAPSAVRFASSGERDPALLPGVAWEGNVPPTPLAVGLIAVSDAENSSTQPSSAEPATPAPSQANISLQIGDTVRVVNTSGQGLRVRDIPSREGKILIKFAEGSSVEIIEGPKQADGYTWWKVRGKAGEGWCAADFLAR